MENCSFLEILNSKVLLDLVKLILGSMFPLCVKSRNMILKSLTIFAMNMCVNSFKKGLVLFSKRTFSYYLQDETKYLCVLLDTYSNVLEKRKRTLHAIWQCRSVVTTTSTTTSIIRPGLCFAPVKKEHRQAGIYFSGAIRSSLDIILELTSIMIHI